MRYKVDIKYALGIKIQVTCKLGKYPDSRAKDKLNNFHEIKVSNALYGLGIFLEKTRYEQVSRQRILGKDTLHFSFSILRME